jgi:hypothetical protein
MIRTMQLVVQLAHEVLAARHASLRASWAFGPLGPRLWDEELTLPGDNTCFASERNSSETRFATHEVSPRIRAVLGKSDARTQRGAILKQWILDGRYSRCNDGEQGALSEAQAQDRPARIAEARLGGEAIVFPVSISSSRRARRARRHTDRRRG